MDTDNFPHKLGDATPAVEPLAGTSYELTGGPLMKCFVTTATEVGLACVGEIVWAPIPGTRLLRGKFEVKWLELVWLCTRTILKSSSCVATTTECGSSEQPDDWLIQPDV